MEDPRKRARTQAPPPPPPPPPTDEPDTTTMGLDGTADLPSRTQTPTSTANGPKSTRTAKNSDFKLKFCTVCASNNNRSMEAHLRLSTPNTTSASLDNAEVNGMTYPTLSFGTGSLVRLPGPSITQPNVYTFNTTSYESMYTELLEKDQRLYRANGILPMLERNKGVKWGPERWQDWRIGYPRVGRRPDTAPLPTTTTSSSPDDDSSALGGGADYADDKGYPGTEAGVVDVVITCEERCWDAVLDDLLTRGAPLNRPVHVFNVDIKDNHEEALVGGKAIRELADALNEAAREEREGLVGEDGEGEGSGGVNGFDKGEGAARRGFDERVPGILASWQERWPALPALWTLAWF